MVFDAKRAFIYPNRELVAAGCLNHLFESIKTNERINVTYACNIYKLVLSLVSLVYVCVEKGKTFRFLFSFRKCKMAKTQKPKAIRTKRFKHK